MKVKKLKYRKEFREREILEGIGLRSEKKVEKILENLKNGRRIRDFISSSRLDDQKGKDFFIIYCGKKEYYVVPLQVKTSRTGQETHKERHPEIPSIRVARKHFVVLENEIMEIIVNFEKGKTLHL